MAVSRSAVMVCVVACAGLLVSGCGGGDDGNTTLNRARCSTLRIEQDPTATNEGREAFLEECIKNRWYEGGSEFEQTKDSIKEDICDDPANRSFINDWDEQCR